MSRILIIATLLSSLTGCFVHEHTRSSGRTVSRQAPRGCAPAHHWDGNACVHNGNANGHKK